MGKKGLEELAKVEARIGYRIAKERKVLELERQETMTKETKTQNSSMRVLYNK